MTKATHYVVSWSAIALWHRSQKTLHRGLETGMVANMLVTKNLALNKVAQVLAYLKIEIASHRDQVLLQNVCRQGLLHPTIAQQVEYLQIVDEIFPLLLTFGEAANNNDKAGSTEMAFAAILTQLQAAAMLLHQLTLLVVNLLSQLGALCSEQTRKSTVISGAHLQPTNATYKCQALSCVTCASCSCKGQYLSPYKT